MDKEIVRIVLLVIGIFLLLGIYLWDRFKKRNSKQPVEENRRSHAELEPASFSLNPAQERAADISNEPVISSVGEPIQPADEEETMAAMDAMAGDQEEAEKTASTEVPALIQMSVVASGGSVFSGNALVQAFTELGLEFGEMEIFHRYDKTSDTRLFSVASIVEPGTFPIDEMPAFQTPGLLLFFQPMETPDSASAFDDLIHTSHELARRLAGEELDSKHNPLTEKTIETLCQSLMVG